MRLLCDENLFGARTLFASLGALTLMPGRDIGPADVAAADVLLLRSQTRVDARLLGDARPRFVGTATAGTEHFDLALLERLGIPVASAPGCNAESVADWVVAFALLAMREERLPRAGARAAVIGCGAIGGRVAARLAALGFEVLPCDPPRESAGGALPWPWVDLPTALQAELVTLHVPLETGGAHPTRHLLDAAAIEVLAPGTVLLNAARGAVVDDRALARRLAERGDLYVALDVYETEPVVPAQLQALCRIVTPHIAGHSLDGKALGSAMILDALCGVLGQTPPTTVADVLPAPAPPLAIGGDVEAARDAVRRIWDLTADDARLRAALDGIPAQASNASALRGRVFDAQRRDYPARRDFRMCAVRAEGEAARICTAAGLRVLGPDGALA